MDDMTMQSNAMKLANASLSSLPDHVSVPQYDRSALTPGIVHIGLGNFHRAHQSWYLHRLMQDGKAHDWAIVGAGVRAADAAMRDRLLDQDCLTTLIELDPRDMSVEVVGSMIDYLPVEPANGALIAQMADPSTRIVSLTVTEGGYYLTPEGDFDTTHEDIQHDVANPASPRTAFGAMVAALAKRKAEGHGPFTALSCDNLQGNGTILRQCIVNLASLSDVALARWIDETVSFPNSMVDCIVPATSAEVIAQAEALGISDAAPVTHEPFRQWVIEDNFCAGRPAWEDVGATLTQDVHAYETLKIRILNGGHQLLANAGEILGVETIADCMADEDIRNFFTATETRSVLPHAIGVPGTSPADYLELITARFENPRIHDTTRRVAFDGSSRHPGFLLPSLRDGLMNNGDIAGLALAEALWARMCAGEREDGSVIEPNDPSWDSLTRAAQAARTAPEAWLAQTQIYGDLGNSKALQDAFAFWLNALWSAGCRETLRAFVQEKA